MTMRNQALCIPLTRSTNSAKLSGLKSERNQARAWRSTAWRRRSKSFRLSVALSNGVGIRPILAAEAKDVEAKAITAKVRSEISGRLCLISRRRDLLIGRVCHWQNVRGPLRRFGAISQQAGTSSFGV